MWGRQGKATIIVKNGSGSGSVWGGQERGDPRRSCHLTLFVNFGESWIVLPLYLQCFCPLGALSLLGLHVVPGAVHAIDSPCCWLCGSAHTSCVLSDTAFWCPLKWLLCSVVLYSFVSHPCPKMCLSLPSISGTSPGGVQQVVQHLLLQPSAGQLQVQEYRS